jgi:3-deoxy-D-manno-octulosonic-acid transferase
LIDLCLVQEEKYKNSFSQLGIDPTKIFISGNLKQTAPKEVPSEKEIMLWKEKLGITQELPVITLASTHDPEEKKLLEALSSFEGKILLAPRHPERRIDIISWMQRSNLSYGVLSQNSNLNKAKIILIDQLGLLPVAFSCSDLAIVGGSFYPKTGGHNVLEPLFYQTPVFFGPYMWGQKELTALALQTNAAKQLTLSEVANEISSLYSCENRLNKRQKAAAIATHSNRTPMQYTLDLLRKKISP